MSRLAVEILKIVFKTLAITGLVLAWPVWAFDLGMRIGGQ